MRVTAFLLLVAALAGCGGDGELRTAHGFSDNEVEWVDGYGAFAHQLDRASNRLFAEKSRFLATGNEGSLRDALAPHRRCAAEYAEEVGEPPGNRLSPAHRALLEACRHWQLAAAAEAEALHGEPGAALERANLEWERGNTAAARSARMLTRLFLDAGPLPRRAGGEDSRVDPLYNRVGERLAHHPVQVRCWSEDDWKRVMRERSAYTDGRLNLHNTGGFAWLDDQRAHIAPDYCRDLDRLAHEHERPRSRTERLELASAVVILAHEVGHLTGGNGEALVECYALQRAEELARWLGVEAEYSRELALVYWEDGYPQLPREYRSRECRDGGELDLEPGLGRWP